MRSLAELLSTPEGRSYLEERGIALDRASFAERLRPPRDDRLRELVRLPAETRLVYVAHQTHVDFSRSVVAKLRAARDLDAPATAAVMLWLDTDRIGSDKAATTIALPGDGADGALRLVPHRLRNLEPRFAPVERERLEEVVDRLHRWVDDAAGDARAAAHARVARLAAALDGAGAPALAECNRALATVLLREHLGFEPRAAFVSTLAGRGLLSATVADALSRIEDVVRVFNAAVDELRAAGVDAQVRPLAGDYLPLNWACERCGARRRLHLERNGPDRHAAFACSCGAGRRFWLGSGELSLGELEATGRWSTDVTLPVYLNDLSSGVVVGRSSALYGLVLDRVLERVLGRRAIPMLVPEDLAEPREGDRPAADSLLRDYLLGT
jgi:hypothetical protein